MADSTETRQARRELTKREQRAQAREARRARETKLERNYKVRRTAFLAIGIAIVVLLVGLGIYAFALSGKSPVAPALGVAVADEGQQHVDEGSQIDYKTWPPASGPHYPRPGDYGFHDQPLAAGYWVHDLEHGAIVVLYNCPQDCPQIKDQLRNAMDQFPKAKYGRVKLVAVPDNKITTPLVALAWDRKLELQDFDRDQLLAFYNAYVDRGPEDVP